MIEWDQSTRLQTPIADLLFNQEMEVSGLGDTGFFMLDAARSTVRRSLRVTKDGIPQGDGQILHRRFTDGVELSLVVELWKTIGDPGEPACGEDLRLMLETLGLHLQAVLNGRGRWFWRPSGYGDDRMLDECRWLIDVSRDLVAPLTTVTFGLDSPFPYFIDATEQSGSDTTLADGVPGVLTNDGNQDVAPVIKVHGTTSAFTITNESLVDENGDPLQIVYDGTTVTSPDYAEIDIFRNTIYLNGDGANLKSGIDPEETDFFALRPGDNTVQIDGADAEFLLNNAWVPA